MYLVTSELLAANSSLRVNRIMLMFAQKLPRMSFLGCWKAKHFDEGGRLTVDTLTECW